MHASSKTREQECKLLTFKELKITCFLWISQIQETLCGCGDSKCAHIMAPKIWTFEFQRLDVTETKENGGWVISEQ